MANVDFSERYKDYAQFIPAVSEMYGRFLVTPPRKRNLPKGVTVENLDFFNKEKGYIFIPTALYSAGQAAKTDSMAKRDDTLTLRDRSNTKLIGDSGGFQIQTGAIKFKGDSTKERMLRWMERTCDWSMILDFPTGGVDLGTIDIHMDRIQEDLNTTPYSWKNKKFKSVEDFTKYLKLDVEDEGHVGFSACLLQTMINNDYFQNHRVPGATKFLNVIQGRTLEESNTWYEHVKHFDFEGWSLAANHKENLVMTMTRLVDMFHDNLIQDKDWIHILGVGKLPNGCVYTTIQRCIREHMNPKLTISYDVSSPFTTAAFGNVIYGSTMDKNSWNIQTANISDPSHHKGGPFYHSYLKEILDQEYKKKGMVDIEKGGNSIPAVTEISKLLQMSDLCVLDDPSYASTWDLSSYIMLMHHNLQSHVTAALSAQEMYDKNDLNHVPVSLLRMKEIIPEIFDVCIKKGRKDAKSMIMKYAEELNFMANDDMLSGTPMLSEFKLPRKSILKKSIQALKEAGKSKIHNSSVADVTLW